MNRRIALPVGVACALTLLCTAGLLVAQRRQPPPATYPSQVRVRLDWECKPGEERRERAETFLKELARAVYDASGARWSLASFVVDDGYTPVNLADRGVLYFRETWEEPSTDDLAPADRKALDRWPRVGDPGTPGYVELGLNQFEDTEASRRTYAEKAAKSTLLAWTGKESLPRAKEPTPFAPPELHRRSGLKLVLRTADDRDAGSDDALLLNLGLGDWRLDNEDKNDCRPAAEDTFYFFPGHKFRPDKVATVRLAKAKDERWGSWLFQSLELWYRGECFFRSAPAFRWLAKKDRTWEASTKTSIEDEPLKKGDKVKSLLVAVRTGDDQLAGTGDAVQVHLGKVIVPVKHPATDRLYPKTLALMRPSPAKLRTVGDLTDLRVTKAAGKPETAWQMKSLAVYVNGKLLYEKTDANAWLPAKVGEEAEKEGAAAGEKKSNLEWIADDYKPPAE